ncbi:Mur ligase [Pilobolus umbonatus]|nr:Mur ligase [Pilobolus umbonatus]
MSFTYKESIDKLNSLQTNAYILEKLRKAGPSMNEASLPEMRQFIKRIGYETKTFDKLNVIHVAGTKGKGSTSAITQSILRHWDKEPIKTGLFTSPHLVAVRERIRINGEPISEELFAKYFQYVWEQLENTKAEAVNAMDLSAADKKEMIRNTRTHPDKPVYFRFLTLVAFHAFIQEKVDCAILEVGVGGEYDSTNVVERPVACGITPLGLDHVSVLGNTIDQIAWHKAGIIKDHVPVVSFDQLPDALAVVKQRASARNAPLTIVYPKQQSSLDGVTLGLAGIHQKYNALVAIELCKIWLNKIKGIQFDSKKNELPSGFKKGLELVKWPGRGQILDIKDTKYGKHGNNVTWYLDGAHTVESLQVCVEWFKNIVKSGEEKKNNAVRILVFNCTHGRDCYKLLKVVGDMQPIFKFDEVVFTTNITYKDGYTMENTNKTVSNESITSVLQGFPDIWLKEIPTFPKKNIHITYTVENAIDYILERTKGEKKDVQVLTTGSLILVGNTLTVLGIQPQ